MVEAWSVLLLFFLLFGKEIAIFVGLHVIFKLHFGTLVSFVKKKHLLFETLQKFLDSRLFGIALASLI